MNRKNFTAGMVLIVGLAAAGCNRHDEKPRGAGASGRPLDVLNKAQIDMERFYKYNDDQDKVIQLMEQPFDAVVKPGAGANDSKAKELTEKVKKNWGEYKFVRPKDGRVNRYRAVIRTNFGDLVLDFFEGFSPDVVRNFMTRLKSRAYDGQPISVEGNALVFGPPLDKQAYTLPARPLPVPLPKGALFAQLDGDRAAGERFGISLKTIPGGGSKVSMFGRVSNPAMDKVLSQFVAESTKKPGSVVIRSATIEVFELPIFDGAEMRLPRLDKQGNLDIPDLAMYTGIANPDVSPPDTSSPNSNRQASEGLLNPSIDPSTMPSKNPNIPPPKDDKRSPKSP